MTIAKLEIHHGQVICGEHIFSSPQLLWEHLQNLHTNAQERNRAISAPQEPGETVEEFLARGGTIKVFPAPGQHPRKERPAPTLVDLGL